MDFDLDAPEAEERERARLSSVAMAMRLLKAFSGDPEIGVSTLSKRLGIAKSTVHRLAVTLVAEGMLEQNPETEKYRLGIELFSLGALVRQRMNISLEARPRLMDLREQTNETVLLGIPANLNVMYVYVFESTQPIRMRADLGVHRPAYCTAVGRAIFAFQPRALVARLLAQPIEARTPQTIVDPATLAARLDEVRRLGYAVEDEEAEFGVRAIAAPVRDATGRVVGAVGIGGPIQRLPLDRLTSFADPLVATAQAVSARLGFRTGGF